MDRDELASLLAQTHSNSISKNSSATLSELASPRSVVAPRESHVSLSPRQVFQSRVRTISEQGNLRNSARSSAQTNPLSPSHVSAHAAQPHSRQGARETILRPSPLFQYSGSKVQSLKQVKKEPDFVLEERAAWNRQSPVTEHGGARQNGSFLQQHVTSSCGDFILLESEDTNSSSAQQQGKPCVLKPFAPSRLSIEDEDRPKTSRGSKAEDPSNSKSHETLALDNSEQVVCRSKFLEGSMNARSIGIASTWNDLSSITSNSSDHSTADTDSDMTPRASRISHESSSSFDVTDFKPTSLEPVTIRKRISKLASNFKSSGEPQNPTSEKAERSKKRLRKSISTWSLHTLGDKMKFFGNSSHDVTTRDDSPVKKIEEGEVAVLNERKRKAEQVYAQQFGLKKQKSNFGFPAGDQSARELPQPSRIKRRSPSPDHTIRPSVKARPRRVFSSDNAKNVQDPADVVSENDVDLLKRPSRRELEKENQQLRAMLREQQSKAQNRNPTMQPSASKSSMHLPLSQRDIYADPVKVSPTKKRSIRGQSHDIPPVPALPSRAVLESVENGRNYASDTSTMKRVGGGSSRPVSMILEEDEKDENKDNGVGSVSGREHWEWPEDVF